MDGNIWSFLLKARFSIARNNPATVHRHDLLIIIPRRAMTVSKSRGSARSRKTKNIPENLFFEHNKTPHRDTAT